jgi:hypothetical protein
MLLYDLEIIKAIPPKDRAERLDGIEYCGGWTDYANMGISVIGAYDYAEDRYRVFLKDNFDEFAQLAAERGIVGGFNNTAFDDYVLEANGISFAAVHRNGILFAAVRRYDLLKELWAANGSRFSPSRLDAVCERNFGTKKTGNGALAPIEWQRGNYGKVIDYCMNDVRMTKQLMDAAFAGASIISPKDGKFLVLRQPNIEVAA